MKLAWRLVLVVVTFCLTFSTEAQQLFRRQTEFLDLIYYDKSHEYLTYHLTRSFENSLRFHRELFDYTPSEPIVLLFQDFGDYGHGGTSTVPWNYISIGIAPFDYVYDTMPANERMNWLMHHELVHVVATDKGADRDLAARKFFRGKVAPEQENPLSMVYSYLTSPRWYAPRWYHEGIAVFLETWMAGGLGRVLGGYDEMVFRTMVLEDAYFYDVVGLESEGKTIDFQLGQNSYLYGTRFVTYLADQHGPEKLLDWFDRRPGSEPNYSRQFTKVYGARLDDEWRRWIEWEKEWQAGNLETVREFPTSTGDERAILPSSLGSVSRTYYDPSTKLLYAAVNYPGEFAHIMSFDPGSGKATKLADVKGPALYYVASLAFDPDGRKLFYTTDNSRGWRDINEIDLATGRRRMLLENVRTGDLVFNRADRTLWGVQHHNGLSSIVRFKPPYDSWETLVTLDYGRDVFDLDISPDGSTLTASLIEINGRQQLVSMKVDDLVSRTSGYQVLHEFTDNSPQNFVFSPDGRHLYGTSYLTGVSNVFRYDFESGAMEALTNAETGYFRPLPISDDTIMAYRYTAEGFQPVLLPVAVREDVNAIRYFGQKVVRDHPIVKTWKAGSPGEVDLDEVTTSVGEYDPIGTLRFASMFPVLEGYKDKAAVGMRFNFADPLGLQSLKVTAAVSADDDELESNEQFHFSASYSYNKWEAQLRYNATDFYDLFGPTKMSRKGYAADLSFHDYLIFDRPRTMDYTITASYFADIDELPYYQDISVDVDSYATLGATLKYAYLRRTIGAVDAERGLEWSIGGRLNYVDSEMLPRLFGNLDFGIPLPIDHSSLWVRTSAGRSFRGEQDDPFAGFFFGGFGNNWVDYRETLRFRKAASFPGLEISEVGGKDFGKLLLEWTLPAVRFKKLGWPGLYANWARASLFGAGLVTNMGSDEARREYTSAGVQVDVSLVMFSNLESMFSVGYAQAFEHGESSDEFMVSLRLLR
jgi:hypothetical protein